MINCSSSLEKCFEEWHIPIHSRWAEEVLKHHKFVNSNIDTFKFAFDQWKNEDISLTTKSHQFDFIPKDGIGSFEAKHILQVNWIIRIDVSLHSQYLELTQEVGNLNFFHGDDSDDDMKEVETSKKNTTNRVLKMELTDGKNIFYGIEKELINGLDELTPTGCKILLKGNISNSHKTLILRKDNVQVLGGEFSYSKTKKIQKIEEDLKIEEDQCYKTKCANKIKLPKIMTNNNSNIFWNKTITFPVTPSLLDCMRGNVKASKQPTQKVNRITEIEENIVPKALCQVHSEISHRANNPQKSLLNVSTGKKMASTNNYCLPNSSTSSDKNLRMIGNNFDSPLDTGTTFNSFTQNDILQSKKMPLCKIKQTDRNVGNVNQTFKPSFGIDKETKSTAQFENLFARNVSTNENSNDFSKQIAGNYGMNFTRKSAVTFGKESVAYQTAYNNLGSANSNDKGTKVDENKHFWNSVMDTPTASKQSQAIVNKSLTSQIGSKRIMQSPSIEYIGTFAAPPERKTQSTQQVFDPSQSVRIETISEAISSLKQAFFYHETCIKGRVSEILSNIRIVENNWFMKVELSDHLGTTLYCTIDPNLLTKYVGMTTEEATKLKKVGSQKAKDEANKCLLALKEQLLENQLLFTLEIHTSTRKSAIIKNIKKVIEPDFFI